MSFFRFWVTGQKRLGNTALDRYKSRTRRSQEVVRVVGRQVDEDVGEAAFVDLLQCFSHRASSCLANQNVHVVAGGRADHTLQQQQIYRKHAKLLTPRRQNRISLSVKTDSRIDTFLKQTVSERHSRINTFLSLCSI